MIASYAPLETGAHGGIFDIDAVASRDDADRDVRTIQYRHGAELALRFSVRNAGRWGVTITSVPIRDLALFRVEELRMGFADPARCCVETQAFQPFALRSGEDRIIELHGRLTGCGAFVAGGGTAWDSYEIHYRILGISRSATIVAHETISIEIPEGYACPEKATGG